MQAWRLVGLLSIGVNFESNGYPCIDRKGVSTPPLQFKNHSHFLKFPSPTLPANRSSQVINRNAAVQLSSINTIQVKQQHNVGFFHFQVHSEAHAK